MKIRLLLALSWTASLLPLPAENTVTQSPMTMEQLMQELRIQGGNFTFTFDSLVYARVTTTTMEFPEGKTEVKNFDTASAQQKIDLFFTASALFVGDYPKGNELGSRKMTIKLSDCKETEGTRLVHYEDKFALNQYRKDGPIGMWAPAVDTHPVLNKEYVLHYYYQEGDPYMAKATIQFSDKPFAKE